MRRRKNLLESLLITGLILQCDQQVNPEKYKPKGTPMQNLFACLGGLAIGAFIGILIWCFIIEPLQ